MFPDLRYTQCFLLTLAETFLFLSSEKKKSRIRFVKFLKFYTIIRGFFCIELNN